MGPNWHVLAQQVLLSRELFTLHEVETENVVGYFERTDSAQQCVFINLAKWVCAAR